MKKRFVAGLKNGTAVYTSVERFNAMIGSLARPERLEGARFEVVSAVATEGQTVAEMFIYGDIGYWDVSDTAVQQALADVTADKLIVHINSGGGDVFMGVGIYNQLRAWAKKNSAKIETRIDAIAASIASVIAMAGDEVIIAKNAIMMIHEASGGCWGTKRDMTAMAQCLELIETNMIVPSYREHTSLSLAELMALMEAETWMGAEDAVAKGFCTAIDEGDDDEEDEPAALLREGLYANAPKTLKLAKAKKPDLPQVTNAADWVCGAKRDLDITKRETWDAAAAKARIFTWAGFDDGGEPDPARAKQCFLAYDAAEPKKRESYKLPFADIIGDVPHAIDAGWIAAEERIDAAGIPQTVKDEAHAVVAAYKAKAEEANNATRTATAKARSRARTLACELAG